MAAAESTIPPTLARKIDEQRERLFEATSILSCLRLALDEVYAPSPKKNAGDLQRVTNVLLALLDDVAAKLDPSALT